MADDDDHGWAVHAGRELRDVLQEIGHRDEDLQGGLLTRFVIVAEYVLPSGRKALGRISRDGDDTGLTTWDEVGMLAWAREMAEIEGARSILSDDDGGDR